jgi:hypothetical protein
VGYAPAALTKITIFPIAVKLFLTVVIDPKLWDLSSLVPLWWSISYPVWFETRIFYPTSETIRWLCVTSDI